MSSISPSSIQQIFHGEPSMLAHAAAQIASSGGIQNFGCCPEILSALNSPEGASLPLSGRGVPEKETVLDRQISISFTGAEWELLKKISKLHFLGGGFSIIDCLHYHGHLILSKFDKTINKDLEEIHKSYLILHFYQKLHRDGVLSKDTTISSILLERAIKQNPFLNTKFFPSKKMLQNAYQELQTAFEQLRVMLTRPKKCLIVEERLNALKITLSIMQKLVVLNEEDYNYLQFQRVTKIHRDRKKVPFEEGVFSYFTYFQCACAALHEKGLFPFDFSPYLSGLSKAFEEASQIGDLDGTLRYWYIFKSRYKQELVALYTMNNTHYLRASAGQLTYEEWVAAIGSPARARVNQYDFVSLLTLSSRAITYFEEYTNVLLDFYRGRLAVNHDVCCEERLNYYIVLEQMNKIIKKYPKSEVSLDSDSASHIEFYERFRRGFSILEQLFSHYFPQEYLQDLASSLEKGLSRDFRIDLSFDLFGRQSQKPLNQIDSIKKTLINQLNNAVIFLKGAREAGENVEPLTKAILLYLNSQILLFNSIMQMDVMKNTKLESLSRTTRFPLHLFLDTELGIYFLLDSEMREIFTTLQSYLPVEEQNVSSSEDLVDEVPYTSSSTSPEVVASCSKDQVSSSEDSDLEAASVLDEPVVQIRESVSSSFKNLELKNSLVRELVSPSSSTASGVGRASGHDDEDVETLYKKFTKKNLKAAELFQLLKDLGYNPLRQRGSHITFMHGSDNTRVTVPNHATLARGTASSIGKRVLGI